MAESLADDTVWAALCQQLYAHDWVVYAKQPLGGSEEVLEYLARYTHRVAISNERLVGMDQTTVRFRVRATPGKRVLELPAREFIERFLLHVLPSGFERSRHCACWRRRRRRRGWRWRGRPCRYRHPIR